MAIVKTKINTAEKLKTALKSYGIANTSDVYHNLSYEDLFLHETKPELEGFEFGVETSSGAVAVDTGVFTGRSPKDKYIVREESSQENIWWIDGGRKGSDNKPITKAVWKDLYVNTKEQLEGKKLYVTDAYCGANKNTRLKIRVITEVAWMSHFVKNMFITPSEKELKDFEPDFVMLNACKTVNENWEEHDLNSDVYVAFNLQEKRAIVGGTWYGGEIKKGFFSIMNYFLPMQGVASMHCSANMGKDGDTAIFFGLSGTGKTTLSADPERFLIGDDEHGWDDDGIFNFEGGCYAKCVDLSKEEEPEIFGAIRRNALLENVMYDKNTAVVDYTNTRKTENTRVSYPLDHIGNIVRPVSKGGHPKNIIFLTADAFGVFPPVAKLTKDQAMYYFLSGYTAKLAGTERGVKEPMPAFSSAFGAAFLLLHPTVYAKQLAQKMEEHDTNAYLVNTGWIGGAYGMGNRIDLQSTRNIIKAILNGSIKDAEFVELPTFGLHIPKHVEGVDSNILNPKNTWKYESAYVKQAQKLADKFIENFDNFTDTEEGQRLIAAGPKNRHMKQFYEYYESKIKSEEQERREEVCRLKDQIYILQNSFNEYISFNSINTNYKKRKLNRHLPVIAYIDSKKSNDREDSLKALMEILDTAGFQFYHPKKKADIYNERMGVTKEKVSFEEEKDYIVEIEKALAGKKSAKKKFATKVTVFMNSIETISNVAVKVGNLLFLKYNDAKDNPVYVVRRLSISGLIHIDKSPNLIKNPKKLLKEIDTF